MSSENTLNDRDRELMSGRSFCNVATLRDDGMIHTVVTWIDIADDLVILNTSEGRQWPDNARRRGHIRLTVFDPSDPYSYLAISGEVVASTHDGAEEHINQLMELYRGPGRTYPFKPGEQRVILSVKPIKIYRYGSVRSD